MAEETGRELIEETRRIWNVIAEWWDDKIGDGNDFQRVLIEPATERLLGPIAGQTILDIGCGAGRFARRMAELGAQVVASDFSEQFINRARQRTPDDLSVEYHVTDATDEAALLSFGRMRFDQAVASMSLMDMATIEPLFRMLPVLLKPGGHFVFSIMHPCFQPPGLTKYAELWEDGDRWGRRNGVKVGHYLTPVAYKGIGIVGQQEPHYYFHRSLSLYIQTAIEAGLVLDGLEEPAFPAEHASSGGLRWDDLPEIPPILAIRLRTAL